MAVSVDEVHSCREIVICSQTSNFQCDAGDRNIAAPMFAHFVVLTNVPAFLLFLPRLWCCFRSHAGLHFPHPE